ncbi:MAG: 1,4-alpha-glucan branching enzyme, partial [Gammaproteobacteria bacterium]|nr:1,4-alpha-glucan branching enzyme [Gammaproteobacteria bacterium]
MPPTTEQDPRPIDCGPAPSLQRLLEGRHHDPFEFLGRHPAGPGEIVVRALLPHTASAGISGTSLTLARVGETDVFEWRGASHLVPAHYGLRIVASDGSISERFDPYCFPPQLADEDLNAFNAGRHTAAYRFMGSHQVTADGVAGIRFAVWAPEAERVSVVGDFNRWDGRSHPMRVRGSSGVWELFVPGLETSIYKYEIRNRHSGELLLKSDPYARESELRPATASIARPLAGYDWQDHAWLKARADWQWLHKPVSIYEVHLGSWRRDHGGRPLGYRAAAELLVPYAVDLGFTHLELMPLTEHPLDESWGSQA